MILADRTQPGLPLKKGRAGTTLFAALDIATGKVIGECLARHRADEFLAFLKKINRETPAHLDLHLILDNYATHKTPTVKRWLARHKRFILHFTPTSCSRPTRQNDGSNGRGYWHGEPWKPVEILAMVLGFIVYWPIGFAVLGWKFWQKKSGYSGDIISFGREKWGNWTNWARGSDRLGYSVKAASGFGMGSTGNRAFDEWRATELARLEEERQKLVAAEREFAEFMENLRHARDREEFERFMDEHKNQPGRPSGQ